MLDIEAKTVLLIYSLQNVQNSDTKISGKHFIFDLSF